MQLGWDREPKFLADSTSKCGMSGSPVLHFSPYGEMRIGGATHRFGRTVAILAGTYVGRLGVTDNSDPQIGTVWHRSVIDEIIDGKCYENLPDEIELTKTELEAAATKVLGEYSREVIENIKDDQKPSRLYVVDAVMKQIHARASPDWVMEALLSSAESYEGPYA